MSLRRRILRATQVRSRRPKRSSYGGRPPIAIGVGDTAVSAAPREGCKRSRWRIAWDLPAFASRSRVGGEGWWRELWGHRVWERVALRQSRLESLGRFSPCSSSHRLPPEALPALKPPLSPPPTPSTRGRGRRQPTPPGTGSPARSRTALPGARVSTATPLQLDGSNDFVNLGNPTALQLTGSMTVSAWVNSAAFPGDDAAIVSKRASGEIGFQLDTTIDRGPRTIGFKLTTGSGGQMFRYGATTLQANTWYHVAGVYDAASSALHVYLNGQLDDGALVGTVTSSQQNSTVNVNIGQRPTGGFQTNGRIDDVRVYSSALSAAQIQTDMTTPVGGAAPPDPTPPTVAITSPVSGAQVADIVNVTADASDNIGVVGVQFLVDGANVGVEDATPPYALAWDTRTVSNGAHTLRARARDAAGNSTLSAPVPVNVANSSSFQNEVLATGLNLPTSMTFLPDGRMLVTELPGKVQVLSPPYTTVRATPFLQLTNVGNDGYAGLQQGIFSIALDPAFAVNRYVYLFYTMRTPEQGPAVPLHRGSNPLRHRPSHGVRSLSGSPERKHGASRRNHQLRQRRKDLFHDGRPLPGHAVTRSDKPSREDSPHQSERHGADG